MTKLIIVKSNPSKTYPEIPFYDYRAYSLEKGLKDEAAIQKLLNNISKDAWKEKTSVNFVSRVQRKSMSLFQEIIRMKVEQEGHYRVIVLMDDPWLLEKFKEFEFEKISIYPYVVRKKEKRLNENIYTEAFDRL